MMRVLSGIQSNGRLHLGNYLGAIKQHIELQEQHECFYFIANYHSLTTVHDRELIRSYTQQVALDYLAFGLDPDDETKAAELPHNQLHWLEIAMVLVGYPNLILLDEPTAGMAPEETLQTAKVLKHLNSTGLTTVVVEHDMAFVKDVAQTVTVLHQGQIFAEGSLADITAHEDVRRIYLGRA